MVLKITPKVEAIARITVVCLLAFILSVSYLPNAVPPSLSYLIGIVAPTFAVSLPHLVFVLGAALPSFLCTMIFGMLGASAVLCAATVNDGLFVVMFVLFTFWCTGLQFGPHADSTYGNSFLVIMIAGLIALSSWQFVKDGIDITITAPPATDGGDDGGYGSLVIQIFETLCQRQGLPDNCYEDSIPQLEDPIDITIPGDGNFAGQLAFLQYNSDSRSLNIRIPGGLWIINGLWTWSGLTNELAVFQNTIIVLCWSILCVAIGRILPPIRTARGLYTRTVLPAALRDSVDSFKCYFGYWEKNETSDDVESSEDATKQRNDRLAKASTSFVDGGLAPVTAFEPRLCRAPFECTWPKLKNLVLIIEPLARYALASELLELVRIDDEREAHLHREALSTINECASALSNNEDPSSTDGQDEVELPTEEAPVTFFTRALAKEAAEIRTATTIWLDALHHPKFEDLKSTAISYAPWIYSIFVFLQRLLVSLTLPFRPKTWDMNSLFKALKLTTGVAILFVMEVFWDSYRNFAINTGVDAIDSNPYVTSNGQPPPDLFSGWSLVAYMCAQTATMEGSIKKGFLRAIGTAAGGFGAWLATIVCSGSYSNYAEVNPYALVAWLTVTTAFAAYFCVDGMKGLSQDSGFAGMYFAMTQALCALEIEAGAGARDDIVVNRIVGNLAGILVAVITVIVPPQVRGADPKPIRELLTLQRETLAICMRLLLENKNNDSTAEDIQNLQTSFWDEALSKWKHTNVLLKDASRVQKFPILKVDPRLLDLTDSFTVTGSFVSSLTKFASHVARNDSGLMASAEFQNQIKSILQRLEAKEGETEGEEKESVTLVGSAEEELRVLCLLAKFVLQTLEDQDCILKEIEQ